ncbi:VOC family protein [Nocardioides carbamazepini]|uniref:VOC family protein n=1 Tax=Nocardioides carbamazepini TaxID=2854259 RepID=UPI00214A180B|nr:VOC family protein [Nocardioides carbamazepini]MCR1784780.1 VOC family protein [Nocardioides carbamazepini]
MADAAVPVLRRIHHVAFAEEEGAVLVGRLRELFGLEVDSEESALGFVERMLPVGECHLQALEATGEGVVRSSLARRGPGLHHVAFEVDDLAAVLRHLEDNGVELIDRQPRRGGGGHLIAFAHPRSFGGILVELVEASPSVPS